MPEYENRIATVGAEACAQLGCAFTISGIVWMDRTFVRRVGSDDCIFAGGRIILPRRMAGKLEPEDWRPLMISSLLYRRRLVWTMPIDMLITLLITPMLTILTAALVFAFVSRNFVAILLFLAVIIGLFLSTRIAQARKKLWLRADTEAAKMSGNEAFTLVLRKIESFDTNKNEKAKNRWFSRYLSSRPTIPERILNLRKI